MQEQYNCNIFIIPLATNNAFRQKKMQKLYGNPEVLSAFYVNHSLDYGPTILFPNFFILIFGNQTLG